MLAESVVILTGVPNLELNKENYGRSSIVRAVLSMGPVLLVHRW